MPINKPIVVEFNKHTKGKNSPKHPEKPRRVSAVVFAVLLLVLPTFVSGILFYTFAMDNINFATETFSTQMVGLLLNSFTMNATYIVAFLKNTGQPSLRLQKPM